MTECLPPDSSPAPPTCVRNVHRITLERHNTWRIWVQMHKNGQLFGVLSGGLVNGAALRRDAGAAGFVFCLSGVVKAHPPCALIIGPMVQITRLFAKGEIKKGDYFWAFVCLEKLLLILRQLVPRSSERSLAAISLLFCCLRDRRWRWSSAPLRCSPSKFLPPPFLN